jgi:hypothetical protein
MHQYEVQYSNNSQAFALIGTVAARNNVNAPAYSFTHNTPGAGKLYYRLKMLDKDGSYEYSPVRVVDLSKNISLQVYPNPASSVLHINITDPSFIIKEMMITDVAGRMVKRVPVASPATVHRIALNGLAEGTYFLQLADANNSFHQHKFVVKN